MQTWFFVLMAVGNEPGDQMIFHVFTQPRHEMESLFKEELHEGSRNVAAISKELAAQCFDHRRDRLAIIDIARGQTTGQQSP